MNSPAEGAQDTQLYLESNRASKNGITPQTETPANWCLTEHLEGSSKLNLRKFGPMGVSAAWSIRKTRERFSEYI